jgi:hypothetical protein
MLFIFKFGALCRIFLDPQMFLEDKMHFYAPFWPLAAIDGFRKCCTNLKHLVAH